MTTTRSRQMLLSLVTLLVTVVISFALAEAVLRIKNSAMNVYDIEMWRYSKLLKKPSPNPVLGHEHVKPSSAVLQKVEIRINADGLRGGPVPKPAPGQRRILVLGSSATLAWGVEEKNSMTARMQRMFDDSGKNTVVMNAGIGNYNTVRYVERFLTKLRHLQPTDILIHGFINDAEELSPGGGNFLIRNSQLAVTLWRVMGQLMSPTGEGSLVQHYKAVYAADHPGFKAMAGALEKLSAYASKKGIRLYLAIMPDIHNLTDYKFGFIHRIYERLAKDFGYRFINLLPAMRGNTPKDLWAMAGDPHPNSRGHELMADALYKVLLENQSPSSSVK